MSSDVVSILDSVIGKVIRSIRNVVETQLRTWITAHSGPPKTRKKKLNKALYPSNTIAFIIRFGIIVAVKLWKQYTTENASHWNQHLFFNVYVPFLYKTAAKVQLGLRAGGHILNGCKCGTAPALGGFSPLLNSVPQLETDLFPPSVYRKNLFGAFVWVSGWDFFFKDVWKWETEALERSQDLLVSLSPRQSPPPQTAVKIV